MTHHDKVTIEHVPFDDPRAARLRTALNQELHDRIATPEQPDIPAAAQAALSVPPEEFLVNILVTSEGKGLGHAALRILDGEWEVKRVIVDAAARGRGVASLLMDDLESFAKERGAKRLVLQTGTFMTEAVAMYTKLGYTPIAVYEPYATAIPDSLCFEKKLGD
jgi:GNAT superfamily N-acetyltransferase